MFATIGWLTIVQIVLGGTAALHCWAHVGGGTILDQEIFLGRGGQLERMTAQVQPAMLVRLDQLGWGKTDITPA